MALHTESRSERRRSSTVQRDAEVRRFLAREIHDGVAQTLTTMLIELANFRADQNEQCDVHAQFEAIESSLREVIASLRELIYNLRGEAATSTSSFAEAVTAQLNDFEANTGIKTRLTIGEGWPSQLKTPAATNLRRIVGEAAVNVRRHSGATHLDVVMGMEGDALASIAIADDGRGLDPELLCQPGMGIVGMRERAGLLGGRLHIGTLGGVGTTIKVVVPISAVACLGAPRAVRPRIESGSMLGRGVLEPPASAVQQV